MKITIEIKGKWCEENPDKYCSFYDGGRCNYFHKVLCKGIYKETADYRLFAPLRCSECLALDKEGEE